MAFKVYFPQRVLNLTEFQTQTDFALVTCAIVVLWEKSKLMCIIENKNKLKCSLANTE